MVGNKFGMLTVTNMIYDPIRKQYSKCECICDCGNKIIRSASKLRNRKSDIDASCGCNIKGSIHEKSDKLVIGTKVNKLTILESIWDEIPKLKCKCDCGNEIILRRYDVLNGHTKSCGCLQKETMTEIRFVDDTGYVSEHGIRIIKPIRRDSVGRMVWECKCHCGNVFESIPAVIKSNHIKSCGCISASSMESYIEKILIENNVDYKSQYTFDDCLSDNGKRLRFDFAITKGDELFCLLEYDGEQHYKSVPFFGGDRDFENRKRRDQIKNEYCKSNNILLIRLPYYLSHKEIKEKIMNIIYP